MDSKYIKSYKILNIINVLKLSPSKCACEYLELIYISYAYCLCCVCCEFFKLLYFKMLLQKNFNDNARYTFTLPITDKKITEKKNKNRCAGLKCTHKSYSFIGQKYCDRKR